MKICKGNMFDEVPDEPIFFTANATIKSASEELIMGAGAALDCKRRFPLLPHRLAAMIRSICNCVGKYGVVYDILTKRGAFQVKGDWRERANLGLIEYSARQLVGVSRLLGQVNVNFPGIGCGGLERADVLKVIEPVWADEDVNVWIL